MQAPASSDLKNDPGLAPGLQSAAPSAPGTPEERSAEFVPVTGPAGEGVPGGVLMVVAYLAFWAVIFRFVWVSYRRTQKLEARLDSLEAALEKADPSGDSGRDD